MKSIYRYLTGWEWGGWDGCGVGGTEMAAANVATCDCHFTIICNTYPQGWPGTSLGASLTLRVHQRDGLAAEANRGHNWNRSRKCIRLVHKFIVNQQLLHQNYQHHKTNLRITPKRVFDIVYNTNLIAPVVWSVRHRKLQKYSTWLKATAETKQLQRCTTDTDCARDILGGSTKQSKFKNKMRPSNLGGAYPQIK